MRKPLKVGIREQIKANLLMLPSGAEPYDTDDRHCDADMFIIDDGSHTHEAAGTTMASFERTGITHLLARAAACIINTGPSDREVGNLLVSWAAMAGSCVLIETEGLAWIDWARLVKQVNPALAVGLRIPDQVMPPGSSRQDRLSTATIHINQTLTGSYDNEH